MGKHFLFASVPGHGHVNPTLPLVEELVRRGHRVTYATGDKFADAVRAAGATILPTYNNFPSQPPEFNFDPEQIAERLDAFLDMVRADFPTMLAFAQDDVPDAICYDIISSVGKMVAEKLGVPDIALVPTFASNEHFSLREQFLSKGFDPTNNPALQQAFQKMQDFAAEHGVSAQLIPMGTNASLNIVFVPQEFQIAGDTFDENFRFVGPSLGRRAYTGDWQPPTDGKPLLFISLGTAFNHRPDFFRLCLEAFGNSGWNVAIATGEHVDRAALGPVPDNIELRPYFPQLAVLRDADLFVSHTGMNSTMESLAAAVPLVAVPQMPEQELNASRAEALGLGRRLDPDTLTAELLRTTVAEVAADESIRANLATMSKAIQAAGGASAAADAIEARVAQ